ncbi:MAG TPA: hypothetical protein VGR47_13735 [Terracidiphilus sp.]|nr:hypothetical protein [Terracidiphilus sp.]
MQVLQRLVVSAVAAGLVCMVPGSAAAQTAYPGTGSASTAPASTSTAPAKSAPGAETPANAQAASPAPAAEAAPAVVPTPPTYMVPAGTKVLLELRSAVDTRSAKAGDGVYLASTFPVVVGNRVMIPAGVYVQGVVDRVARAGRVKGRAQLDMHFTSMIFPNGTVVEIPGMVDSLPGAKDQSVKNDGEGTIEQHPDKGRHAGTVAEVGIPTGGTVGAISGAHAGHPIAGGVVGLAAGAAAAGIVSLFTRGADVSIPQGTQVEMVLQRPLILQQENLAGVGAPGTAQFVPAPNQPKPMEKPRRHGRILCPMGGLGCP